MPSPGLFSVDVISTMNKNQPGGEWAYLAYRLQSITEGIHSRSSIQEPGGRK